MQRYSVRQISAAAVLAMAVAITVFLPDPASADEGEVEPVPGDMPTQPSDDGAGKHDGVRQQQAADDHAESVADSKAPAQAENKADAPRVFRMLGSEVAPGTTRQLSWVASQSFTGVSVPTPVLVANGTRPGPTLCLTAAVHGDELNGIEMVRRLLYGLKPDKLSGTVVGVPIVNLLGFRRNSRYLPDRRDLNRYFPGDPEGSTASRIAYSFFENVVRHCDVLVDLHTGSFHRTNLVQLRADLKNPEVLELTQGFGATAVLQNDGTEGTLRRAATDIGIPAVTVEAGEPKRFQPDEVAHGVKGIRTLLNELGMVKHISLWGEPQPVYYEARWLRAETGGILFSRVAVGDKVNKGDVLGTVTDPITNRRSEIRAPQDGRILGMALNQAVIPGFAAYNVGIQKSSEEVSQTVEEPVKPEPQELSDGVVEEQSEPAGSAPAASSHAPELGRPD